MPTDFVAQRGYVRERANIRAAGILKMDILIPAAFEAHFQWDGLIEGII